MKDENYEIFKQTFIAAAGKPFLNLSEICKITGHSYDYIRPLMQYRRGKKIGRQYCYPIGEVIQATYEDVTRV